MSNDDQEKKRIAAAVKRMAAWVKQKEQAYKSGDPVAIQKVKKREAELAAESLRIGREWAEKTKRNQK